MHDHYAAIDISFGVFLIFFIIIDIRFKRRVSAAGRKVSVRHRQTMATLMVWALLMPVAYRYVPVGTALVSLLIMLPLQIMMRREISEKRQQWIDSELAAGRIPKECRVYNDWARPDPE